MLFADLLSLHLVTFLMFFILVITYTGSLIPRPSPVPFSWPHTWPLNRPEKREKAWYNFYIIKLQGRWTWSWCNVDPVSVIMATYTHTRMC